MILPKGNGDEGARTPDLCIANAPLSQLSYVPVRRGLYRSTQAEANVRRVWMRGVSALGIGISSPARYITRTPATPDIDEGLIAEARRATGIREHKALLHAGLKALIRTEAARRLIELGGAMKHLRTPRRRRSIRSK